MKPIFPFIIDINYQMLNNIFIEVYDNFKIYSDYRGTVGDNWQINKLEKNHDYINEIITRLKIQCSPRFYILKGNSVLGNHVDNGTKCSINFLLSEANAPITILDKQYYYKNAIINTTKMHSVNNLDNDQDRRILKLSVFEKTYEETVNHFYYLAKNNVISLV